MIFKPVLIRRILAGDKTMTRRPIDGRTNPGDDCRYKVGKTYAIQPGMARPTVATIRVLDVRRERLGDISHEDARAEGFRDAYEFLSYWSDLYGRANDEQRVWVIWFELVEQVAACCPSCDGKGVVPLRGPVLKSGVVRHDGSVVA